MAWLNTLADGPMIQSLHMVSSQGGFFTDSPRLQLNIAPLCRTALFASWSPTPSHVPWPSRKHTPANAFSRLCLLCTRNWLNNLFFIWFLVIYKTGFMMFSYMCIIASNVSISVHQAKRTQYREEKEEESCVNSALTSSLWIGWNPGFLAIRGNGGPSGQNWEPCQSGLSTSCCSSQAPHTRRHVIPTFVLFLLNPFFQFLLFL